MILRALGLAAIAASVFAGSALAHHSFAIFDQTKVLNQTGTVKDFELINPHAWLHVVITDALESRRRGRSKAARSRSWWG